LLGFAGAGRNPGFEIDSPKMRSGREELDPDASSTVADVAGENNPAFLLFLSDWVYQDEHLAVVHLVAKHEQAAVRIHDKRFADFAEFTAIVPAALGLKPHLVKDALAAALGDVCGFAHVAHLGEGARMRQLP